MAFRANFPGRCTRCGEKIQVGQIIEWNRKKGTDSRHWHQDKDGGLDCSSRPYFDYLDGANDAKTEGEAGNAAKTQTRTETSGNAGGGNWLEGLAEQLMPYMDGKLSQSLEGIADIIDAEVKKKLDGMVLTKINTVVIENKTTGETKDLGVQHKLFPTLLSLVQVKTRTGKRPNVWLTGPAGSGKTTGCEKVAEALGLEFFHVGAMDNEYKLLGFKKLDGEPVETEFERWYRNGGVICLDEIDSWHPNATLALNAALANGHATFASGLVKRHPDAIAIACANTWGFGATTNYVGRMKQDKAFLDRFPFKLDWGYDEDLEKAIAQNEAWVGKVASIRAKARTKGYEVIVSPRASEWGAAALECGLPFDLVEQTVLRQGMTEEQWKAVS